jgi:GNAT superfamily N-acetyltransferase
MNHWNIRGAVTGDAEAIVRTHHDAVWKTAGNHYSPDILEAWAAKLSDSSYEQVRREILDKQLVVVVAERLSRIAGFGMLVPADEEVRAVYVNPSFARQGVGTAILQHLEDLAREDKVLRLNLAASLNAERFYAKHGFEIVQRTTHRLRAGKEMACVRMTKQL